jgi:hypothetical protein
MVSKEQAKLARARAMARINERRVRKALGAVKLAPKKAPAFYKPVVKKQNEGVMLKAFMKDMAKKREQRLKQLMDVYGSLVEMRKMPMSPQKGDAITALVRKMKAARISSGSSSGSKTKSSRSSRPSSTSSARISSSGSSGSRSMSETGYKNIKARAMRDEIFRPIRTVMVHGPAVGGLFKLNQGRGGKKVFKKKKPVKINRWPRSPGFKKRM